MLGIKLRGVYYVQGTVLYVLGKMIDVMIVGVKSLVDDNTKLCILPLKLLLGRLRAIILITHRFLFQISPPPEERACI